MKEKYTQSFYDKYLQGSYDSANTIISFISNYISPKTVIDFGCGSGAWLNVAQEIFGAKILGIDQHEYKDIHMLIDENEYITHDLTKPLHLGKHYDLAISVEVAEHIDCKYSDILVETLCNHSDIVLFSAAIPMQGGTGHINERPCSYWAEKFSQRGYYAMDCLRPALWNNENIEIWYINNAILYVSEDTYNILSGKIDTYYYPLDIIHPKMLEKITKNITKKFK